jgi:CRISPR/Cas system-associated endoribonuclease Cas2
MEKASKKRARRGQLEHLALSAVAAAGIAGLMLTAPNVLQLLKNADPLWLNKKDPKLRLGAIGYRLQKKGMVEWIEVKGVRRMRITPSGRTLLNRAILKGPLQRPKKWDGKWRIVVFDIRDSRKGLRDKVRTMVSNFGFTRLQNSVWAYPYDCEDIITLLKTELRIGSELLYMIVDAIEYDRPLRKHFNLPE